MSKTFTTSTGREIALAAVPQMLVEKVREAAARGIEVPPVPTYEAAIGDGDSTVTYEHDETTLETDEDRAAWASYQAALNQQNNLAGTRVMELYFVRGIAEEMDEGWAIEQEYFGIEVPADPIQRRLHWVQTELLVTPGDIQECILAIMSASGVDEEALKAARASFRGDARPETNAARRVDRAPRPKKARR